MGLAPLPLGTGARVPMSRSRPCLALRLLVRIGLASTLLAGGFLIPSLPAAEKHVATAKHGTTVLSGAHYVDASAFLTSHGLQRSWVIPGRRARFTRATITVEIEADKREISFNGMRVFFGDPVLLHRNGLWLSRVDAEKVLAPLLRPELFAASARVPKKIVIDAGHGGRDTGTRNVALGLDEKGFALDVAQKVAALLEREGHQVVMTRNDDRFIALAERAEIANRAKADLFVSIHFNSSAPEVKGSETYVLTPQFQRSTGSAKADDSDRELQVGNAADPWNTVLGYQIQRQLLSRLGTVDRGLKRARFAVLRLVECPAVLVEAGYLSHPEEGKQIASAAHRDAIAQAIVTGIAGYAAQVQAARKP